MRRIYQFDGVDHGLLSVGECSEPERVALCIEDQSGREAHMVLSREDFRTLCSLSYDIRFVYAPAPKSDADAGELQGVEAEVEMPF
jgi:hypothetical protein